MYTGNNPALRLAASGADVKAIGLSSWVPQNETLVLVPVDSPAQTLQDLKGKRVAYLTGTVRHSTFSKALESVGLSDQRRRRASTSASRTPGPRSPAATSTPWSRARASRRSSSTPAQARILFDAGTEGKPEWSVPHIITANGDFLKKYPEVATRLLEQDIQLARWVDAHPEETIQIFVEETGNAEASVRETYRDNVFYQDPEITDAAIEALRGEEAFMAANDLIKGEVDYDTWIDRSYYQAAVEALAEPEHQLTTHGPAGDGSAAPSAGSLSWSPGDASKPNRPSDRGSSPGSSRRSSSSSCSTAPSSPPRCRRWRRASAPTPSRSASASPSTCSPWPAFIPLAGWLADRLGAREVLVAAVVGFAAASRPLRPVDQPRRLRGRPRAARSGRGADDAGRSQPGAAEHAEVRGDGGDRHHHLAGPDRAGGRPASSAAGSPRTSAGSGTSTSTSRSASPPRSCSSPCVPRQPRPEPRPFDWLGFLLVSGAMVLVVAGLEAFVARHAAPGAGLLVAGIVLRLALGPPPAPGAGAARRPRRARRAVPSPSRPSPPAPSGASRSTPRPSCCRSCCRSASGCPRSRPAPSSSSTSSATSR